MPKLLMNFLLHTKNNNGSLERYHYINMNSSEANLNGVPSQVGFEAFKLLLYILL